MEQWFHKRLQALRKPQHMYVLARIYTHDKAQQDRTDLPHLKGYRTKNFWQHELPQLVQVLKGRAVRLSHNLQPDGSDPRRIGTIVDGYTERDNVYTLIEIDAQSNRDIVDMISSRKLLNASLREKALDRPYKLANGSLALVKTVIDLSLLHAEEPPNRANCHILMSTQPPSSNSGSPSGGLNNTSEMAANQQQQQQQLSPEEEGRKILQQFEQKIEALKAELQTTKKDLEMKEQLIKQREDNDKQQFEESSKEVERQLALLNELSPEAKESANRLLANRDKLESFQDRNDLNNAFVTLVHSAFDTTGERAPKRRRTDDRTTSLDSQLNSYLQGSSSSSSSSSSSNGSMDAAVLGAMSNHVRKQPEFLQRLMELDDSS